MSLDSPLAQILALLALPAFAACVVAYLLWAGSRQRQFQEWRRSGGPEKLLALQQRVDQLQGLLLQKNSADFLSHLRYVNTRRWREWSLGELEDPLYCALELGGEAGEVLNVVKKLVREQRGWAGSRSTKQDLGEELGDVLICLDTLARAYDIDLAEVTARKFNMTSIQRSLSHRLYWPAPVLPTEWKPEV